MDGTGRCGIELSEVNGLSVRVRAEVDVAVVCVVGELDMATTPTLRRVLKAQLRPGLAALVLDLSGVTFMGSSGLSAVVEALTWAAAAEVEFRIAATGPMVLRPMEVTGLDRMVTMFDSVADAVRAEHARTTSA